MAIAIVQSNEGTSTSATVTASFATAPADGNVVVLCFASDDYNGTPNAGWTQSTGMEQQVDHGGYIWWKAASGGSNSFQYTIGSATNSSWILVELSGVDTSAIDVSNGQSTATGGSTYTTPSVTPSTGARLALAAFGASHTSSNFSGDSGTWTNSFTHLRSSGPASATGTRDFITVGTLALTGNGSTAYSTGMTYPASTQSRSGMIIVFKEATASNKTLTASGGSYALSGTAATLKLARKAVASSGSLVLSGTAANLKIGRKLAASGGSFSLTGSTAGFARSYRIIASSGSLSLAGTAATLKRAYAMSAGSGAFTLTGTAATLSITQPTGKSLPADAGAFSITGTSATLRRGLKIAAASGSFTLTGTAATLRHGYRATASSGTFTLSGQGANLRRSWVVTGAGGTFSLTGSAATLSVVTGRILSANGGVFSLTGTTARLALSARRLAANAGVFALSGTPANLTVGTIQPELPRQPGGGLPIILVDKHGRPVNLQKKKNEVLQKARAVVKELPAEDKQDAKEAIRDLAAEVTAQHVRELQEILSGANEVLDRAMAELARLAEEAEDEDDIEFLLLAS